MQPFTASGDLRLSQGFTTSSSFTSGRLEVFLFGQWGTVCDDRWDSTNSDVACSQLGFPGASRPISFGTSSNVGWERVYALLNSLLHEKRCVTICLHHKKLVISKTVHTSFTTLTHTGGWFVRPLHSWSIEWNLLYQLLAGMGNFRFLDCYLREIMVTVTHWSNRKFFVLIWNSAGEVKSPLVFCWPACSMTACFDC